MSVIIGKAIKAAVLNPGEEFDLPVGTSWFCVSPEDGSINNEYTMLFDVLLTVKNQSFSTPENVQIYTTIDGQEATNVKITCVAGKINILYRA